ncbi:hypothetical protein C5167_001751 [Papaver somniferum]|uniref:Uncharacterized protein n=1 Tax=Papaver somniferum TaxID=3469 RepID=A0A4Y7KZG2_PAPSO|nr:hypothetical protein C5167_001751 [Papaver somniferum]
MTSFGSLRSAVFDKEERKQQYQSHIRGLNAFDRHKKFLKDYVDFYGTGRKVDIVLPSKTDQDTLREGHRFIRSEEDDMDSSWEQRLVKRYYDKLFKEYPLQFTFQHSDCIIVSYMLIQKGPYLCRRSSALDTALLICHNTRRESITSTA